MDTIRISSREIVTNAEAIVQIGTVKARIGNVEVDRGIAAEIGRRKEIGPSPDRSLGEGIGPNRRRWIVLGGIGRMTNVTGVLRR